MFESIVNTLVAALVIAAVLVCVSAVVRSRRDAGLPVGVPPSDPSEAYLRFRRRALIGAGVIAAAVCIPTSILAGTDDIFLMYVVYFALCFVLGFGLIVFVATLLGKLQNAKLLDWPRLDGSLEGLTIGLGALWVFSAFDRDLSLGMALLGFVATAMAALGVAGVMIFERARSATLKKVVPAMSARETKASGDDFEARVAELVESDAKSTATEPEEPVDPVVEIRFICTAAIVSVVVALLSTPAWELMFEGGTVLAVILSGVIAFGGIAILRPLDEWTQRVLRLTGVLAVLPSVVIAGAVAAVFMLGLELENRVLSEVASVLTLTCVIGLMVHADAWRKVRAQRERTEPTPEAGVGA